MSNLHRAVLISVIVSFFPVRSVVAQLPTPPSFLTQPLQPTVAAVTPPVKNCDFVAASEKQSCLKCIREKQGSWTVIGCLSHNPQQFVASILKIALGAGGGIAFLAIVFGAFTLLTSAGSPEKINQGKKTIFYSGLGILVIIFSVFIFEFIGLDLLGLPGFGK